MEIDEETGEQRVAKFSMKIDAFDYAN